MENQKKLIAILVALCIIFYTVLAVCKGPFFPIVKFHYCAGFIKQSKGDLVGCINEYNAANDWDKEYPTAYISRGSAYMDLKNYDKAISDYTMAIKLSPENEEPYAYRGRAYYEINKLNNSKDDFDKAIRLNKNFRYAYSNRALLKYTKLNNKAGGCEDLKKAAELGDEDSKKYLENDCCN
ncbi:tetratricopeptide repeat protein [Flavobacterium sp.]|uniref:tetratricopeptide repeat protein n=1 Tax=Flavobacterium sp. TaxID=239 RepID=UPI00326634CB